MHLSCWTTAKLVSIKVDAEKVRHQASKQRWRGSSLSRHRLRDEVKFLLSQGLHGPASQPVSHWKRATDFPKITQLSYRQLVLIQNSLLTREDDISDTSRWRHSRHIPSSRWLFFIGRWAASSTKIKNRCYEDWKKLIWTLSAQHRGQHSRFPSLALVRLLLLAAEID